MAEVDTTLEYIPFVMAFKGEPAPVRVPEEEAEPLVLLRGRAGD